MYNYTESGLHNIVLLNGVLRSHDGIAISDVDDLHHAIAIDIINCDNVMSADEIAFIRAELDLSVAELAKTLGVSDNDIVTGGLSKSEDTVLRALYCATMEDCDMFEVVKKIKAMSAAIFNGVRYYTHEQDIGWHQDTP